MARGGQRPGAGKPKGYRAQHTLDKEAARAYVRETVIKGLEPLLKAQMANALGLKYLVTRDKRSGKFVRVTEAMARVKQGDAEETIEVWEKDPSVLAFTDLLNRALDKPKEQVQEVQLTLNEPLLARLDVIKARHRREALELEEPKALPPVEEEPERG